MKVTVIDYGLSNLRSVQNAFARCLSLIHI